MTDKAAYEQLVNLRTTLTNMSTLLDRGPGEHADLWLEAIDAAQDGLREMRYRIESLQSDRKCLGCGGPVVGRSDRLYCSGKCRTRNHRGKGWLTQQRRQEAGND